MIVGPDQILQHIHKDMGIVFGKIFPHLRFQCPIESLYYTGFNFFIVSGEIVDVMGF